MALIRAEHVGRQYQGGEVAVSVLKEVSFEIDPDSFIAFIGPSGNSKTTLLDLFGCLDKPTAGRLTVVDTDAATLHHVRVLRV